MAGNITIPNTFAAQTGPIPLSQLDADFTTVASAINSVLTYSSYYADTSGAPNSVIVTINSPQTFAYVAGATLTVKIANTNSGASTINVNSLGTKSIVTSTGAALTAGQLASGAMVLLVYDGTNFQMIGVVQAGVFSTVTANASISGSSATGAFIYGTLTYSDTNNVATFETSANSYMQMVMQNASSGATASTNYNVSNDLATASTNYAEFGINSSGFTGSGSFNQPGYAYLAAASTDLAIGTYGAKGIHFVVNNGATDAAAVTSAGNWTFNAPSSGSTLSIAGITGSATVVLTSATGTANTLVTGAAITLGNGSTTGTALQNTGGQTEIWQFLSGSWNQRAKWDTNGSLTINAPSSGTALTVTAANSAIGVSVSAGQDQAMMLVGTASGANPYYGVTSQAGKTYALQVVNSTGGWRLYDITAAASRIDASTTGNVTINAPSSGVALTVNAVSGTHSTKIADSANTSYNAGYLELPVNGQGTPYTAVLADAGKCLYYSATGAATFTIPANGSVAYPVGTTLTFVNDATGATNMTIAITTDTLVLTPGGSTGSRTLAQYGRATAHKVTATRWFISGTGLT